MIIRDGYELDVSEAGREIPEVTDERSSGNNAAEAMKRYKAKEERKTWKVLKI